MNHFHRKLTFFCLFLSILSLAEIKAQTAAEVISAWTFDALHDPQYWYGTSCAADFGHFPEAMLYANGTHGSSQFATVTTSNYAQMLKFDWVGTELGDPRSEPFNGYCLGIKHPNSSGRSFVIACPTTLYHNLRLRYAVTRSNTGFKKMTFAWSLTGTSGSYQVFAQKPCDALDFEVQEVIFEHFTQLEDQPMIYLRITVDSISSTAYQGNIKFDNICILGEKCIDTLHIYDTIISGDHYDANGFFYSRIDGEGDYTYERRIEFPDLCDSLYQLHLNVIDTTQVVPDEPDDPDDPNDTIIPGDDTTNITAFIASKMVKIYPNPFSDEIHIEAQDGHHFSHIIVYNSLGQRVYDTQDHLISGDIYIANTTTLHTENWAPGIYYVVVLGESYGTTKIIKW